MSDKRLISAFSFNDFQMINNVFNESKWNGKKEKKNSEVFCERKQTLDWFLYSKVRSPSKLNLSLVHENEKILQRQHKYLIEMEFCFGVSLLLHFFFSLIQLFWKRNECHSDDDDDYISVGFLTTESSLLTVSISLCYGCAIILLSSLIFIY